MRAYPPYLSKAIRKTQGMIALEENEMRWTRLIMTTEDRLELQRARALAAGLLAKMGHKQNSE